MKIKDSNYLVKLTKIKKLKFWEIMHKIKNKFVPELKISWCAAHEFPNRFSLEILEIEKNCF